RGRRCARRRRRRCPRRARRAACGRRSGDGARAARRRRRLGAARARRHRVRPDVEAALVRGELVPGDVEVADGTIVEVGLPAGVRGRIAVPGFVDLQVNGFAGVDFLSASTSDYETAGDALLEGGVTAYQPTFITAPESA